MKFDIIVGGFGIRSDSFDVLVDFSGDNGL